MPIAEGVNVQDVDVTALAKQILEERREHVPRVQVEERSNKVESVRRS